MSDWYDSDGNSLGDWVPIDRGEYHAIRDESVGQWQVFASNTDPWGRGEVYTAWGLPGEDVPRVDHRCLYEPPARDHELLPEPSRCLFRRFVPVSSGLKTIRDDAPLLNHGIEVL